MIDPNLVRWIFASTTKHFDSNRQGLPLDIEGFERQTKAQNSLEFRLNGPDFQQVSKGYLLVEIEINILVTTLKNDKDAHRQARSTGIAVAAFTDNISVFKLGTGAEDDQSLLGCLSLQTNDRDKIIVTDFGPVTGMDHVLQATVEGRYKMTLRS